MSKTLTEIATQLRDADKKVQLIYAFNGVGKTRLSREFKYLITPRNDADNDDEEIALSHNKILYYNAFTEDLFYWAHDPERGAEPKMSIQSNSFTDWVLKEQGQDKNIIANFHRYTNDKLTPHFNENFTEVTFSLERGDDENSDKLKISKGEESNFIWSVFYTLLDQVIDTLKDTDITERETSQFDQLEYVFIDDPVSSLDENHLIELAVNLAGLVKYSPPSLKFIITTHNPLFYNVLHNELNSKNCYLLGRFEDGTFALTEKNGDSNRSFSYHLHLKQTLKKAIEDNKIEKYHFTLLRNLYEKTASFLGYERWGDLLENVEGGKENYLKRITNFSSHRTLSDDEVAEPTEPEKQTVKFLLDHLLNNYGYWQQKRDDNDRTN